MKETDYCTRQKETCSKADLVKLEQAHRQMQNGKNGKNHGQQYRTQDKSFRANQQLQKIFEVLKNEVINFSGDLPTSFAAVEKEIARCISECLSDVHPQNRDIAHIQSLLRDYKVLVPVRVGNPTVSLDKVHVILQDNYPDSCFCKLMNILLAGWMGVTTKVISF